MTWPGAAAAIGEPYRPKPSQAGIGDARISSFLRCSLADFALFLGACLLRSAISVPSWCQANALEGIAKASSAVPKSLRARSRRSDGMSTSTPVWLR